MVYVVALVFWKHEKIVQVHKWKLELDWGYQYSHWLLERGRGIPKSEGNSNELIQGMMGSNGGLIVMKWSISICQ